MQPHVCWWAYCKYFSGRCADTSHQRLCMHARYSRCSNYEPHVPTSSAAQALPLSYTHHMSWMASASCTAVGCGPLGVERAARVPAVPMLRILSICSRSMSRTRSCSVLLHAAEALGRWWKADTGHSCMVYERHSCMVYERVSKSRRHTEQS